MFILNRNNCIEWIDCKHHLYCYLYAEWKSCYSYHYGKCRWCGNHSKPACRNLWQYQGYYIGRMFIQYGWALYIIRSESTGNTGSRKQQPDMYRIYIESYCINHYSWYNCICLDWTKYLYKCSTKSNNIKCTTKPEWMVLCKCNPKQLYF